MLSDRQRLMNELIDAGVDGVDEFGRFVNDTRYFEPSRFDDAAAAPVLLRMLPELNDPRLVSSVGRHLQARSVRRIDGAFEVVLDAYRRWATAPGEVGWVLGDTLARLADETRAETIIGLATDHRAGSARACLVEALWRFKGSHDVAPMLEDLVRDPDVTFMAVTALQRTVGPARSLDLLEDLASTTDDEVVERAASQAVRRIRKKLSAAPTR